jgi:hypothetical protein
MDKQPDNEHAWAEWLLWAVVIGLMTSVFFMPLWGKT